MVVFTGKGGKMLNKKEKRAIKIADSSYLVSTVFLGILSFLGMHIIPDWQLFCLWGVWLLQTVIYICYMSVMSRRYQIRRKWKLEREEKRKKYALSA